MDDKVIAAIAGAVVGSLLTFFANFILALRKGRDEVKLQTVLEVLGFLSKTVNREAPSLLIETVGEIRNEWAKLIRALYLLNVPEDPRRAMDSAMTNYLDGLEELKKDPNRKGEVERRRELAREEAFRLMRRLGF